METKVYSSTAKGLVRNFGKPILPLYSRVYKFSAFMAGNIHAVISEPDEHGTQRTVEMSEREPHFSTIDKYSKPVSKKFGIGSYFDDIEPEFRFEKSDVEKAIEMAKAQEEKEEAEKKAKDEADRKDIEELPKMFPHLSPKNDRWGDYKELRRNLVADLKHNFPGMKYRIIKRNYDSIDIYVPAQKLEEVEKIMRRWDDHSFDWSGDYYDYNPSNFNRVFGGVKFLFFETLES